MIMKKKVQKLNLLFYSLMAVISLLLGNFFHLGISQVVFAEDSLFSIEQEETFTEEMGEHESLHAATNLESKKKLPEYTSSITIHRNICVLIYDITHKRWISQYNPQQCQEKLSPGTTFHLPLALIGFDANLLKDADRPRWAPPVTHNHSSTSKLSPETPRSWLLNGKIWYGQRIANHLSAERIIRYLKNLHYGSHVISTPLQSVLIYDPKLRISAYEQMTFLQELISETLLANHEAQQQLKEIVPYQPLENGWGFRGLEASIFPQPEKALKVPQKQIGWYIGWLEKQEQQYVLVMNMQDLRPYLSPSSGRLKNFAKLLLNDMGITQ